MKYKTCEMEDEYKAAPGDILNLQKQIEISPEHAEILMNKWKGDLFKATLDAFKLSDGITSVLYEKVNMDLYLNDNTLGIEDETNTHRKLEKARIISDEKDSILNDSKDDPYETSRLIKFEYIPFNYDTELFLRKSINTDKYNMETNTIEKYLLDTRIEELGASNVIPRFLGGKSKKLYKKWSLTDPAIFFLKNHKITRGISDFDKYENRIGTSLLRKAGHLLDNEILVGSCVVVDNWFLAK
jgi:hypothetical protein